MLLFNRPLDRGAATITEHIAAFAKYSRYRVWSVNTERGFPSLLDSLPCSVLILHYSLFGVRYMLDATFLRYIRSIDAFRIAFFQDEHRYCGNRFRFLNDYRIDAVDSMLVPPYAEQVYRSRTAVQHVRSSLPGYVAGDLQQMAERFAVPDAERTIDIGYRGRRLSYYMGRGAQEKYVIGVEVQRRAAASGLVVDIASDESDRLYGDAWYRFMAACRGILGVESGVSIFDIDDEVRAACEQWLAAHPRATFDETYEAVLRPYEDNISYRTISPRHFEAAAFRVCQILYEGHYSGAMQPMVHYIPLKKDFSNWDEVVRRFKDPMLRARLAERAYQDLIASGRYSYHTYIEGVDADLERFGAAPTLLRLDNDPLQRQLDRGSPRAYARAWGRWLLTRPFPGRARLVRWIRGTSTRG